MSLGNLLEPLLVEESKILTFFVQLLFLDKKFFITDSEISGLKGKMISANTKGHFLDYATDFDQDMIQDRSINDDYGLK